MRGKLVGHEIPKITFELVTCVQEKILHRYIDLAIVVQLLLIRRRSQFRSDEWCGFEEECFTAVRSKSMLNEVQEAGTISKTSFQLCF